MKNGAGLLLVDERGVKVLVEPTDGVSVEEPRLELDEEKE